MVVLDFAHASPQHAKSARVRELQTSPPPTFRRDVAYRTHLDRAFVGPGVRLASMGLWPLLSGPLFLELQIRGFDHVAVFDDVAVDDLDELLRAWRRRD